MKPAKTFFSILSISLYGGILTDLGCLGEGGLVYITWFWRVNDEKRRLSSQKWRVNVQLWPVTRNMFRITSQKGKYNHSPFDFASKKQEAKIHWMKDEMYLTKDFDYLGSRRYNKSKGSEYK